jgi:hypothetical protein
MLTLGEHKSQNDHPLKLVCLTLDEAQRLANKVCAHEKFVKVNIKFSNRQTKRMMASFQAYGRVITLYPKNDGNSVHVLLHELSHCVAPNHDKLFKSTHMQFIKKYGMDYMPKV